jgi:hypothetical protein
MSHSPISDVQFQKQTFDSSVMVDSNLLGNALLTQPEIAESIYWAVGPKYFMNYLTGTAGSIANAAKNPKSFKMISAQEFQWALMGNITKSVTIMVAGPANAGLGHSIFRLTLDDDYFNTGNTVRFEDGSIARVMEQPVQSGPNWEYKFQLVTSSPDDFVVAADIAVGRKVALGASAYEEFSDEGYGHSATPLWLKNQMTILRESKGITRTAATEAMVIKLKTLEGKESAFWCPYDEWLMKLFMIRQREWHMWYGKYNKDANNQIHLKGSNGRVVMSGAGFFEQISPANTFFYNDMNEDYIHEILTNLQLHSKDATNSNFVAVGGSLALKKFRAAMTEAIKQANITDLSSTWLKGGSTFSPNNITTYEGFLGTKLTVIYNPYWDDPTLFTKIDAESGHTAESGRLVFMDVGSYDGQANIEMVTKGGNGIDSSLMSWWEGGSIGPDGIGGSKVMRSNAKDGYVCHTLSEIGLKVRNPLACGQLILDV